MCLLAFILYLDRVCISQAAKGIENEFDISHTAMALVFNAFSLAYCLFEVPTGHWGDRYGSRGVLARIVVWWSAFTILTGMVWLFSWETGLRVLWFTRQESSPLGFSIEWVPLIFNSFFLLVIIRFLFGAGEAGAYPNTALVVKHWFPPNERGRMQGIILTCAQVGAGIAPAAVAALIMAFNWRVPFFIFGGIGFIWAGCFYYWYRDDPAQVKSVNAAELNLIRAGNAQTHGGASHPSIPWKLVLTNRNIWLLGGIQIAGAFAAYINITWLPTFLKEAHGMSETDSGISSSIVLFSGAIGCFVGGFVNDYLIRKFGLSSFGRRIYGGGVMCFAALCVLISVQIDQVELIVACLALAHFFAQAQQSTWWSMAGEVSGKHHAALFGLMNSIGGFGSMGSPLLFGLITDSRKNAGFKGRAVWDPGFYVDFVVLTCGGLLWLFLNVSRSVEPAQPGELSSTNHPPTKNDESRDA